MGLGMGIGMSSTTGQAIVAATKYYTIPTDALPFVESINKGEAMDAAISAAKMAYGLIEMAGINSSTPLGLAIAAASLLNNLTNAEEEYNTNNGQVSDQTMASILADVATIATLVGAAAALGTIGAPAAAAITIAGTATAAALTVYGIANGNNTAIFDNLKTSMQNSGNAYLTEGETATAFATSAEQTVTAMVNNAADGMVVQNAAIMAFSEYLADAGANAMYIEGATLIANSKNLMQAVSDIIEAASEYGEAAWDKAKEVLDGLINAYTEMKQIESESQKALSEYLSNESSKIIEAIKDKSIDIYNKGMDLLKRAAYGIYCFIKDNPFGLKFYSIPELYNAAQAVSPTLHDPLTLDLDGDGIETLAASLENPILFDHNGDGLKTGTGWISPDDGLLVMDRNGNGTIDDGTELFGDSTPLYAGGTAADGFAALAQEDTNADGVVNSLDANWANLRIWQDLNSDAISQAEELLTMDQAGISEFDITSIEHSQVLANGNQIADLGTYRKIDGAVAEFGEVSDMADIDLTVDTFNREFPDEIPVSEEVALLPDMEGSGLVRDLQEAAMLSTGLKDLLTQYSAATTRAQQMALIDQLLYAWADTSGLVATMESREPESYRIYYDRFGNTGRSYSDPSGSTSSNLAGSSTAAAGMYVSDVDNPMLSDEYRALITSWSQKLHILESFNGRYFFTFPEQTQEGASALMGMSVSTAGTSTSASGATIETLVISFNQTQIDLLQQSYDALRESVYEALFYQTRFDTVYVPLLDEVELVIADDGSITRDYSQLEQHFANAIASDNVTGLADLIEFNKYLGNTFLPQDWQGNIILAEYIRTTPVSNELQLMYADLNVIFVDAAKSSYYASDKDSFIVSRQDGGKVYGYAGNDFLIGNEGADNLYGGNDNDILDGGTGNDSLDGGAGNDTYLFRIGAGQDTISNYDATTDRVDTIQFKDVASTELRGLRLIGHDLIIDYGVSDSITIQGFIGNTFSEYSRIDYYVFSDGVIMTQSELLADYPIHLTDGADYGGSFGDDPDIVAGGLGNDTIYGGGGDDQLYGEGDDDLLYGGEGNDILDGGTGNDSLIGNAGNDTYVFRVGSGQDVINNSDWDSERVDTIRFEDVASTELRGLRVVGHDLIIEYGTSDTITIPNYYGYTYSYSYHIDNYEFSDGVVMTQRQLIEAYSIHLTDGADYGGYFDSNPDVVWGGLGNDTISTAGGDDILYGEGDNDSLSGGDGNDILDGGTGNDSLNGGNGNDTYIFRIGDGQDTISNNDTGTGRVDTIQFLDVASTELRGLRRSDGNLYLDYGVSDSVMIVNYYGTGYQVDQFVFSDATITPEQLFAAYTVTLTSGADILSFTDGDDIVDGGAGNDKIYGRLGNDQLFGGADNDSLYGDDGDDTLVGGAGNDSMQGSTGNDTYVFSIGDGQDTISNYDTATGRVDTIQFVDVASTELRGLRRSDGNLYLDYGVSDSVMIVNYYGTGYQIDQFVFSDATITPEQLFAAYTVTLTSGADILSFTDGDDIVDGGAGNDKIYGRLGNDQLFGGADNDSLYGDDGDDTLVGGAGNDSMQGSTGNDTYVFSLGSGQDVVSNYDSTAGRVDTIQFLDVASTELRGLRRSGGNLYLDYGTSDSVTIENFYATGYQIDQFVFSDATITPEQLFAAYTVTLTSGVDILSFTNGDDIVDGGAGNDKIYGLSGNDQLFGGADNDSLYGADGDDTLVGGAGNDSMQGSTGNDTYVFSLGSGQDVVSNYDSTAGRVDTIQFLDVASTELRGLRRSGANLYLDYGTSDSVLIENYFGTGYQIDQFVFSDVTLTPAQLLAAYTVTLTSGSDILTLTSGDDIVDGGAGIDKLYGSTGNDTIYGGADNDTLYGESGNDFLEGGSGADSLYGSTGDDILSGGQGNDYLQGDEGSDTYRFGLGDGADFIVNYCFSNPAESGIDTLEFGEGITRDMLDFVKYGNHLRIDITGTTDSVTINAWLAGDYHIIDQIRLSNGEIITASEIIAAGYKTYGTESNDTLTGSAYKDIIYGYDGNDSLDGAAGNDVIYGGSGADSLYGNTGDDILSGGAGNDFLRGDVGSDTYRFNLGDGADLIENFCSANPYDTGVDTLEFGEGITRDMLDFVKYGNHLRINVIGTTDSVTINAWLVDTYHIVDQIRLSNGEIITASEIIAAGYKTYGTESNDTLTGSAYKDIMYGYEGDDSLDGAAGNDVINGGTGNDTLIGGTGSDTYTFRRTDGADTINDYSTTTTDADILQMTDGITSTEPVIVKQDGDLYIFVDTGNYVKIASQFSSSSYGIERLEVSDGHYITRSDIEAIVNTMSSINNDSGMDVMQKYNAMMSDSTYITTLAQTWKAM